jgi:SAM-dependent methyltransferase
MQDADVRAAWDANAPAWANRVRAGRDLYRELFKAPSFLAFLPPLGGLEAIDLGCGEGATTRLLARTGARMTGVDLSPGMIAEAQAEEARAPLGITYRVGSCARLGGTPPESFDAAVSTMAMMDCSDFSGAVREVFRILKPGAPFCFSVLHPCFITPDTRWVRDDHGRERGLMVGRYFDESPFVETFRFSRDPEGETFSPFKVPRFPRRLETYVNTLLDTGFSLTRIEEPRPSEAATASHPWLQRWRDHAAIFLYLAARKPTS